MSCQFADHICRYLRSQVLFGSFWVAAGVGFADSSFDASCNAHRFGEHAFVSTLQIIHKVPAYLFHQVRAVFATHVVLVAAHEKVHAELEE